MYDRKHIYDIPIKDIEIDFTFNSRGVFETESCRTFAADIKKNGLMHPILLCPNDGDKPFFLVSGFRRLVAHHMLKAKTIEARIWDDLTREQAIILNASENMDREPIGMRKEVELVNTLKEAGITSEDINRSYTWFNNRLRLSKAPKNLQEAVYRREMTIDEALESMSFDPSESTLLLAQQRGQAKILLNRLGDRDCIEKRLLEWFLYNKGHEYLNREIK